MTPFDDKNSPIPRHVIGLGTLIAAMIQLGACGSSGDDHAGHADAFQARCSQETRADIYAPGMEKAGTMLKVTLMESVPGPPAKGDNRWVVQIADNAGTPLDGLAITVTPFMPDHGHGTSIKAIVTASGTPGEYIVEPVNLWMPGYWTVTFDISDGASIDESIFFGPCIEG